MESGESPSTEGVLPTVHPLRATVERLLYEDESNVLDFKADQYPFGQATEEQRGELLKDILAMANSWGRADTRYILIGVREVVGGRAEVVGVSQHLPEHALQQLVSGRSNRPVELSYHAVDVGGKSVGVIAIPRQHRPIFLKKSYGRLEANVVYMRRGSSTAVADPDEIAQMGASNGDYEVSRSANLRIELGFPETGKIYEGEPLPIQVIRLPDPSDIPDFARHPSYYAGLPANRNYYRDVARYFGTLNGTLGFGFYIQNIGDGPASNVTLRIEVQSGATYEVLTKPIELPDDDLALANALIEHAEEQARPYRPKLRKGPVMEIRYDLGVVQPGFPLWTDPIYVIPARAGTHPLAVEVYCDQLPAPLRLEFEIKTEGESFEWGAQHIVALGNQMLQ